MHEYSIVRSLLKQALDIVTPISADRLRKLTICVGPLSGVEPLLLAEAFKVLKYDFEASSCELEIDNCSLMADCSLCGYRFEIVDFDFRCPQCASSRLEVTQGDRIVLRKIQIEDSVTDELEESLP